MIKSNYLLFVSKIKKIFKESLLKRDYRKRMIYGISLNCETNGDWRLYNTILFELRKIGDDIHIDEIRYRVSDGESPLLVIKEVLKKLKVKTRKLISIEKKYFQEN